MYGAETLHVMELTEAFPLALSMNMETGCLPDSVTMIVVLG